MDERRPSTRSPDDDAQRPLEPRGPVSIGDAIRAVVELRPRDDATAEAIRALLGIDREEPIDSFAGIGPWKPSTPDALAPTPVPSDRPLTSVSATPIATPQPEGAPTIALDVRLARTGQGRPPAPEWADAKADDMGVTARGKAPPPSPLFRPPRGRAILSTTLATVVNEGDVDLERVVEILASGQTLSSLPRLPSLTLRRGVELLIDRGPGIDPFRGDVEWLVRNLDDILSDDQLDVSSFAGCPSRGVGSGPRQTWVPWTSTRPGTPLVVVTDLGIGGLATDRDRASAGEWLRFAHRVHDSGRELIALVPYEAGRWPPLLSRAMSIVHWSERTTVGSVRRARHDAHARLR